MLKVLIVDDEFKGREVLKEILNMYCKNVTVTATAKDVTSALSAIREHQPELVFLDIELEQETGFDLLEQASPVSFEVIFTTAYAQYAINAIKASAIDYLIKPVNPDELKQAVQKVIDKKKTSSLANQVEKLMASIKENAPQKIGLPTKDGLIFVEIGEIVFCEAEGTYTNLHLKNGSAVLVSKPLKEYESLLEAHHFLRVHNSFLINLNEIKRYYKGDGGHVIMSNDKRVDVSKRRKEIFLSKVSRA